MSPSRPLPPNPNPSFIADYPEAVVYPAHKTNWAELPNRPRGLVLHTPEEDADDTESTPVYFSQDHNDPRKRSSTTYYLDNDGDMFQCVPERFMHFGNGLVDMPAPAWADPRLNLNVQTLSIEVEGRAHTIHQTMPVGGVQFNALVRWCVDRCRVWGIPPDREHIIGHYQVSAERSDPGALFPWDALINAVRANSMLVQQGTFLVLFMGDVPVWRWGSSDGLFPGRISKNFGGSWYWLRTSDDGTARWSEEEGD